MQETAMVMAILQEEAVVEEVVVDPEKCPWRKFMVAVVTEVRIVTLHPTQDGVEAVLLLTRDRTDRPTEVLLDHLPEDFGMVLHGTDHRPAWE